MASSETDAEIVNRLFPSFSSLPKGDAKSLSEAFTSVVLAQDETERIHAEMPSLTNKLRAVSYRRENYADVALCDFWINRGTTYNVTFEVGNLNDDPEILSMRFLIWQAQARYGTGYKAENRVEISAKYRSDGEEQLQASMHAGNYDDPIADGWTDYASTGMRELFARVAVDLGLIAVEDGGNLSCGFEENVKQLMSSLVPSKIARISNEILADDKQVKAPGLLTVLDLMFEDIKGSC